MRDLHNNIHPVGVAVATVSDTTAVASAWVDTQGFNALSFLIAAGTLADADATFTVLVEDADASDGTGAAAVADSDLLGTEAQAGFTFADDGEARKIGYVGVKRWVRCTVTPVNNAGSAPIAIIPVLGHPHFAPTPNPPQ